MKNDTLQNPKKINIIDKEIGEFIFRYDGSDKLLISGDSFGENEEEVKNGLEVLFCIVKYLPITVKLEKREIHFNQYDMEMM